MGIRPAIRPGAVLLRRNRDHLQIGTAPGFVIRDQPGLMALLRMFDGTRTIEALAATINDNVPEFDGNIHTVVSELSTAGVVCDARSWEFPGHPELSTEARCRCAAGLPVAPIQRRATYRAALVHDESTKSLASIVALILQQSGVQTDRCEDADLTVVFSLGEPARSLTDNARRSTIDHLLVVIDEERIRIGPLIRPGQTPCMHCYDLHRTDWDRAWPALATQFGRPHRTIVTPPAVSSTTAHTAAAEVAANVLTHCDSNNLGDAGRITAIGPTQTDRAQWQVNFHPACGCALLNVA